MSKKILGEGIEPKCAYCEHGKPTPDGANVLCYFCGVPDSVPRTFRFNTTEEII